MKYFLIGARGAGKTTLGRMVAAELDLPFVDVDELIESMSGKSVAEIIEDEGWESFRHRESAALREAVLHYTVIATGGGMVLAAANRELMREQGKVIYLRAPAATLSRRLSKDENKRPSLTGLAPEDEIAEVLRAREPLYVELAEYVIDAAAPVAQAMVSLKSAIYGRDL